MKAFKTLLLLLALGLSAYGQAVNVTANKIKGSATAPSGACSAQQVQLTTSGVLWTCQSGEWGSSGGGSGTPGGASGTLQYNNGGNFGAVTSSSVSGANITLAGTITIPTTTSSSTGVIYKGATAFFHNYNPPGSDGGNVFIGGAGNFTMAWGGVNSYEAARNTIVGAGSGNALTTGYFNNILGYETCRVCTTAAGTSVIGARAMFALTTGHDNAGVGDNTLYSVTTGERNGAFTYRALYNLVTGDENVALGYGAGYTLTSGTHNTFLGAGADVSAGAAAGLVNSTAVGFGATVTASNQIVMGNASVTETRINGTVTMLSTGANMRMVADGTSAKDAGIYVGAAGDIYFANWAGTRGWLIAASGAISQIGTGTLTIGGAISQTNIFTTTGTINANNVGLNLRLKGDGTAANDAAVLAIGDGRLYFSNYNVDRGWLVTAAGVNKSLGGDIAAVASSAHGLVLKSPDGTCYRATMANGGTFSIASITCP